MVLRRSAPRVSAFEKPALGVCHLHPAPKRAEKIKTPRVVRQGLQHSCKSRPQQSKKTYEYARAALS